MTKTNEPPTLSIDTANQLHRTALRLFRLLRDTRTADGLTPAKLGVLGRLYRIGMATATELAAYLRIQPQSLTRLVAELEREGLITRRKSDEDRRRVLLEISEKGLSLLTGEVRDQRMMLARIIALELTSAEQGLLRLATGLMDHIAEAAEAMEARDGSPEEIMVGLDSREDLG